MTTPAHKIIPAPHGRVRNLWLHVFCATLAGLAVRLVFVLWFPADADDSRTYLELARNWADLHIYGIWLNLKLIPTDLRLPGYPVYLAAVATLLGRTQLAILLSQVLFDLLTCYLTALLATALVAQPARQRVAIAGLWLAATCPFVANYSAVVLTEVLTTFLTTAALACFALSLAKETGSNFSIGNFSFNLTPTFMTGLGAFLTGLASLVRPEMPLLLIAAGSVVALRQWQRYGWRKLLRSGALMTVAFLFPLAPWTVRNLLTLHEFQISAPRYATVPGEYVPKGFYSWNATWMCRYRDVYETVWKIGSEPIDPHAIPNTAFDSPEEKRRIFRLLDQYNHSETMDISPEMDRQFGEVALNRTHRNPFRTYVWIPFQRALTIWFTPRTELLPFDGKVWPVAQNWQNDPVDFSVTLALAGLGYFYVALAIAGVLVAIRIYRSRALSPSEESVNAWGIAMLLAYIIFRTAFLTTIEAPEPRYVISCYPAVLALAAMSWSPSDQDV